MDSLQIYWGLDSNDKDHCVRDPCISFFVQPYGTSMVGPYMQACECVCVCVSLISTRAAPFSRVFLGTYNLLLLVVIVDKVPSSCGSIVSSRSQAFEG